MNLEDPGMPQFLCLYVDYVAFGHIISKSRLSKCEGLLLMLSSINALQGWAIESGPKSASTLLKLISAFFVSFRRVTSQIAMNQVLIDELVVLWRICDWFDFQVSIQGQLLLLVVLPSQVLWGVVKLELDWSDSPHHVFLPLNFQTRALILRVYEIWDRLWR